MSTYASGGIVMSSGTITISSGSIITGTITASNSFSNLAKQTKKLSFELSKIQDPHYCNNRRGGPRSKIRCEVPVEVPHEHHHGRSSGRWYSWKEKSWD